MAREWPRLRSVNQARFVIRGLYERSGFVLAGEDMPGDMVRSEYGQDLADNPLSALFTFVDELTAVVRFLSVGFIVGMPADPDGAGFYYKLAAKTVATLGAIRALSVLGLDGNARMQLRHHYETMLLWSRARLDDDARLRFSRVQTSEEANIYWNTHLAREKSEKFIRGALGEDAALWIGFSPQVQERTRDVMSLSSHPSNLELIMNQTQDFRALMDHDCMVVRGTTPASHFTLGTALTLSALPFGMPKIGPQKVRTGPGWTPPEAHVITHNDGTDEYYLALQRMILGLFLGCQPFLAGIKPNEEDEVGSHLKPAQPTSLGA
jgi:hypothetical protein